MCARNNNGFKEKCLAAVMIFPTECFNNTTPLYNDIIGHCVIIKLDLVFMPLSK